MKTRHNKTFVLLIGYCTAIVLFLAFVACIGMFSSCNTSKRASRLIDKADRIDNTVLPAKCAERYPTKDSVHNETVYKEGVPIIQSDTVIVHDTLTNKITEYITKKTAVHDTLTNTEYKQVESTSKVVDLTNKLNAANQTIAAKEEKLNIFIWVAGVETALIVLFIAWKIFKPKVL